MTAPNRHAPRDVVIACPACGADVVIAQLDPPDGVGMVLLGDAPRVRLADLTDEQFANAMEIRGPNNDGVYCSCEAHMGVNQITRAVEIDPSTTALQWIAIGRVPLAAALALRDWRWPASQRDGGIGTEPSLALEMLWLLDDARLPALLARCAAKGLAHWEREGEDAWVDSPACYRDAASGTLIPLLGEPFGDSLRAACPEPPSIVDVVAAIERFRKTTPCRHGSRTPCDACRNDWEEYVSNR